MLLSLEAPAFASGGGLVAVSCTQGRQAGCGLLASTPGSSPQGSITTLSAAGCHDPAGKTVTCADSTFGWLGPGGCYYRLDSGFRPPAWDTADQHRGQAGAFYLATCLVAGAGTGGGIVWLPAGSGLPTRPALAVLARQATNRLVLPTIQIEASPSVASEQLVNLPTWLWVASSAWRPVSATAAVPGESVTATARPILVTWRLGDGTTLVCHGPGTPYRAGDSPKASSPTCGHTYRRSSAGEPNEAFPVSATITWAITWQGGGRRGTEPALRTIARTAFRVAESQALNTAS